MKVGDSLLCCNFLLEDITWWMKGTGFGTGVAFEWKLSRLGVALLWGLGVALLWRLAEDLLGSFLGRLLGGVGGALSQLLPWCHRADLFPTEAVGTVVGTKI